MRSDYAIRTYESGDEHAIIDLLKTKKTARERAKALEYWKWKYRDNPAGFVSSNICVAECDRELIGHVALVPLKVKANNSSILAARMTDGIVHPRYRSRGIFWNMMKHVMTNARQNGILVSYAVGLGSRIIVMKRPHWRGLVWRTIPIDVSTMKIVRPQKLSEVYPGKRWWIKLANVGFGFLVKRSKPSPIRDNLEIAEVKHFDKSYDDFWSQVSVNYDLIIERSSLYLNWRHVSIPRIKYTILSAKNEDQLQGYAVLRIVRTTELTTGYIVDIMAFSNENVVSALISKSLEFFQDNNVNIIYCWMLSDHPYDKILRDAGFFRPYKGLVDRILSIDRIVSRIGTSSLFQKKDRHMMTIDQIRRNMHLNICVSTSATKVFKTFSYDSCKRWFLTYADNDEV